MLNQGLDLLAWDPAQVKTFLARGDVATEIIDYNKKSHVGLIRAGSRGLGQFRSLWVGSDDRKLMRYRLLG
jgi:hypothetical protein